MAKDGKKHKGALPAINQAWLYRMRELKAINDARLKELEGKSPPYYIGSYRKLLEKHGRDIDKAIAKLEAKLGASRAAGEHTIND